MNDFIDELVIPLLSSIVVCFYVIAFAVLLNMAALP